ncbi:ATP-grasp domain-containing protein [Nitratifractor sp.]|uniref:ATP-grasp domain-containing protein n=1 Tax=Nitratifractor sp. TaxID=2268144 RepID=UPI0025DB109D|nr:ATP-grasp domain-containing protein [Nitratifractor sp.]
MSKRILVAGGSHADIPVILSAKRAGYEVITSGNNPEDFGHPYGDLYISADYSNPEAVLNVAEKFHIDAIVASANDFSALSCAYVAEKLSLPGHDRFETAEVLHHKDRFRALAQRIGLKVPKAIRITKKETTKLRTLPFDYPVMVKPVDLSGGKGMTRVETPSQLANALQKAFSATRKDYIVIEEYIQGSNHGYSTFLVDGKIVFAFMDDEHYFLNPFLVSGASTSLKYSKTISQKINRQLETLAQELQLANGLLHVQFILQDEDPFLIEICRRTPGDLYVKLVEYATGFPMAEALIDFVSGNIPNDFSITDMHWVTRHCVMAKKNGKICGLSHGSFENKIIDKMVFFKQGDEIRNYLTYKAEIDHILFENKKELKDFQEKLTSEIRIRLCE